ncbi:LacI family DNA-binding transcriptional regulator [Sediminispirochaeta bajacaliforniensis]|uniref:LacI family DNA-binding transcriptional regulator n=1 Tax=Sediminispirochaeta bajacaliforniensis TaxID=148 RepID=UPI0003648914|nr:LacI family DNA-binding transcriptional regulator [Sediminispirochaeta bajacaliforniensis]
MKVRISDIAERANVSAATVSLVLNNKPGVGEKMREQILAIAKEMNYKGKINSPKRNITFLKITKNGHLQESSRLYSAYFDDLVEGLSTEARSAGYNINMTYFQDLPQDIDSNFPESEGFILLASDLEHQNISALESLNKPMVLIGSDIPIMFCDQIGVDNTDATYKILHHLYRKGHRHIGLVTNNGKDIDVHEREDAFKRGVKALGITFTKEDFIRIDPLSNENTSLPIQIKKGTSPSAFVCCDDTIALKFYQTLVLLGFRIAEEVTLTGFDYLPESRFIHPPLTTFQFPHSEMGKLAFSILKSRIEKGEDGTPFIRYKLQGKLIDRLSAQ